MRASEPGRPRPRVNIFFNERAMSPDFPRQHLDPTRTTWHITFGTYGTRLHGGSRPSVDKRHNQLDTPFVPPKIEREDSARGRMKFPPQFSDGRTATIRRNGIAAYL